MPGRIAPYPLSPRAQVCALSGHIHVAKQFQTVHAVVSLNYLFLSNPLLIAQEWSNPICTNLHVSDNKGERLFRNGFLCNCIVALQLPPSASFSLSVDTCIHANLNGQEDREAPIDGLVPDQGADEPRCTSALLNAGAQLFKNELQLLVALLLLCFNLFIASKDAPPALNKMLTPPPPRFPQFVSFHC